MTYDLTTTVQALIALCVTVITAVAIPWFRAKYGTENIYEFMAWVKIGVKAAEQLYTSLDGDEKKKYVLNFLEAKGYRIDEVGVDSAIEAAVLELHSTLYGDDYAGSKE